jgi:hypothetical protein
MKFTRLVIICFTLGTLLLNACSLQIAANPNPVPTEINNAAPPNETIPETTEIFFWLEIPTNSPVGETIQLVVLDEVTGLPWNQARYDMQPLNETVYGVALSVRPGTLIRYRYERVVEGNKITPEFTASGSPTHYRLFMVDGPGEVHDQVARWEDTPLVKGTGRIYGVVTDAESGLPVPNLMILAGGERVLTNSDGSFMIPRVVEGKHQIVVFAMNGQYLTYKQDAIVVSQAATPASIQVSPAQKVSVTFAVELPDNTIPSIPIKIAGNYQQFGNTFTDLQGGTSVLPSAMPELIEGDDGIYRVSLELYAGMHLQYKYSLGDGFWNVEQSTKEPIILREIRIPRGQGNFTIRNEIETWQTPGFGGVIFDLKVPSFTPQNDQIYVQFYYQGWMAPLPMWKVNQNRWAYQLVSPLGVLDTLTYRYCRNGVCGDQVPLAAESEVRETNLSSSETLLVSDAVLAWNDLTPREFPATVLPVQIISRSQFVGGVMLTPTYNPTWDAQSFTTIQSINGLYANQIILSPTWHATLDNPPHFTQILGKDQSWESLTRQVQTATVSGLDVALFPQIDLGKPAKDWWGSRPESSAWWQSWWEQYSSFVIHHADLAQRYGAKVLILGGEWIQPGLPGAWNGMPVDIQQRWNILIDSVRLHYDGHLAWYVPFSNSMEPNAITEQMDLIYVHWGVPLATWSGAPSADLQSRASILINDTIGTYKQNLGKPVVLIVEYPSARGGVTYCLPEGNDACPVAMSQLSPLNPDQPEIMLDLQEQVEVYNAVLAAINESAVLDGVVSGGYFPPVGLEDKSTSIHGKPAEDVLRYWYKQLLIP